MNTAEEKAVQFIELCRKEGSGTLVPMGYESVHFMVTKLLREREVLMQVLEDIVVLAHQRPDGPSLAAAIYEIADEALMRRDA